jgi:molecular chaperone DnaK (HSP70)
MAPAPKATLAIDFGTSNTVVAVWDPAQAVPRLLTLPGLSRPDHSAIPSLVYVKGKGQLLVGETVRAGRWGAVDPQRLFQALICGCRYACKSCSLHICLDCSPN